MQLSGPLAPKWEILSLISSHIPLEGTYTIHYVLEVDKYRNARYI